MTLKIASWNTEGRLGDEDPKSRSIPSTILKSIEKLNADVLVLLEAHDKTSLDDLKIKKDLENLGYTIYNVPYEDDMASRPDAIQNRSSLMLLSKLPVKKFEIIRLANTRNALITNIYDDKTDKIIRFIGIHLDDRSEATRLKQVSDLIKIIKTSKLPTVMMGDFNAMHGQDLWPAKFLRNKLIKKMLSLFPSNLGQKAIEMASGKALDLLESETDLIDIDPRHQPTTTPKMRGREWLPSIRLIQIDHIFVSPNIKTSNFTITPDGGADHRAIIADIDIN